MVHQQTFSADTVAVRIPSYVEWPVKANLIVQLFRKIQLQLIAVNFCNYHILRRPIDVYIERL